MAGESSDATETREARFAEGVARESSLRRFAACHEASHAIAAYHLRFPYDAIQLRPPRDDRFDEADFRPDPIAYEIGLKYLDGRRVSHRAAVVSVCTVWAIARRVHRTFHGFSSEEADACSRRDLALAASFLKKQRLSDDRRKAIWELANSEAARIVSLSGFRRALEAVAVRLLAHNTLSADEVEAAVERAVGDRLKSADREPSREEVALAAYHLHESGRGLGEVRDWLLAERGVRFGIAVADG